MNESVGYGADVSMNDADIGINEVTDVGYEMTKSDAGSSTPVDDGVQSNVDNNVTDIEGDPTDVTENTDNDGEMTKNGEDVPVDYEKIMREDLEILRANFPELSGIRDISELSGAMRYAALRDLGLTAIEAYLATSHRVVKKDTRSHLSSAVSHTAGIPGGSMSRGELAVARELFSGMTDSELYSLYKRVTH